MTFPMIIPYISFPIWKNITSSKPPIIYIYIYVYIYICLWYENVWRLAFLGVTNVDPTWPSTVPLISSVFEGCHEKCNKINSNLCGKGPEFMTSKKWHTVAEVQRLHLPILMFNGCSLRVGILLGVFGNLWYHWNWSWIFDHLHTWR